jgi:hypothetical protein
MARAVKEGDVRDHLVKRCEAFGATAEGLPFVSMRKVVYEGRKGAWDWWLFFLPGWRPHRGGGLCIVELKKPGEGLEHHQVEEAKVYQGAGIAHCVLDSIDAVDRLLS